MNKKHDLNNLNNQQLNIADASIRTCKNCANHVLGTVNINQVNENMLPCPFCGGKAGILCGDDNGSLNFIIIGCLERSMLCPNPSMVIYNHNKLGFDLKYWNMRFNCA